MAKVKLFVVDTGPLITLAAADALDYLLYPSVDVVIPDAVFYEATRDVGKLGAPEIVSWMKANHMRVELAVTNAFVIFEAAREANPTIRQPNLGEQAAIEVIEEPARLQGDERGILLCEETAVMRRVRVLDRERIIEISTMDFLRVLESERRIQSADAVFERALAAGRSPARRERFAEHDPAVRDAVRDVLAQGRTPSDRKG
jgi:hypothetical protein